MRIELQFDCNKKETLESMQCYENTATYNIYADLFDEIMSENEAILKPVGYYVMTDQRDESLMESFEKRVCCIVTLGKEVDLKMKAYFDADDYMKGVLMSSIADAILFSASTQFYQHVFEAVKAQGMMMTKRKEPGTSDVPVTAQKWILEIINAVEQTQITITSGYMLNPTKSMGYFYGAGKALAYTPFDHDCSLCDHVNCQHRKVYLTIKTEDNERVIRVKSGSNLLEVLREHKVSLQADCSGNQTCGKCKVKVVSRHLNLSDEEKTFLTDEEVENGVVLACCQKVTNDLIIEVEKREAKILTDFDFPILKERKYAIKTIEGLSKSPEHNQSATDLIHQLLGKQYLYNLPVLRQLSNLMTQKSFIALIKDEESVVALQQEIKPFYGIGIDIGTTTVAIALVDLMAEMVIAIYKCMNPQKAYGADVISRIQYDSEHQDRALTQGIQEALLKGISELMASYQVSKNQVIEIAVAGNTTMQYLLMGINPKSLAVSPFLTTHQNQIRVSFEEVFMDSRLSCDVVMMPGLSAYIGADILSGLYTTNLEALDGNFLLIDIGTNGELVIKAKGRMICVATAAGPAFEGANITCGMGSLEGAICGVTEEAGDNKLEVIGDGSPKGICGSGLIDLMALSLNRGLVDETGRILEGEQIRVAPSVAIYQKDIRELQLAKAAIAAGIEVLLQESKCGIEELDQLFLAGGFGYHLNVENAIRIGLLPEALKNKTKVIGNSSLGGSVRYLLEKGSEANMERIKQKCAYIELSTNALFYDYFIDHMNF